MKLKIITLIGIIMFSVCFAAFSQGFKTPAKGKAAVYIVRVNATGALAPFYFFNNDIYIGKLKKRNYLMYECDPGKQTFRMISKGAGTSKLAWPSGNYVAVILDDKNLLTNNDEKNNINNTKIILDDKVRLLFNPILAKSALQHEKHDFSYNIDGNVLLTDIDTNEVKEKPNHYIISAEIEEGKTYLIACKGTTKLEKVFFPINVKDTKEYNRAKEIIFNKKPDIVTSDDNNRISGPISSISTSTYAWLIWHLYTKRMVPYHHMKADMVIPSDK